MLPIFLSFGNKFKVGTKWLRTGNAVTKEEVERAIIEQKEELHMSVGLNHHSNGSPLTHIDHEVSEKDVAIKKTPQETE
jgi:hypothetical protein